jgi:Fic-DOC domain mobile mystery protein B
MGLDLEYTEGQTPLDEDEKEGLLIPAIATRGELDEFEQQNIEKAVQWSLGRSFRPEKLFTEALIRSVHKRMYGDVWAWAGEFRNTNKNIGVDKWQIPTALRSLLGDVTYWYAHQIYEPDELTIRFKHRLVSIHCFPNGNGRHSRLIADIVIEKIFKMPVYTWGAGSFKDQGEQRTAYLKSMRSADAGDIQPLITFARS